MKSPITDKTKTIVVSAREVFELLQGVGVLGKGQKFVGWSLDDGGKFEIIVKEE